MTEVKFDLKKKKVFVAGHNGMVGKEVIKELSKESCIPIQVDRSKLDLLSQDQVNNWFLINKPDVVIICAAKVGGILANSKYPVDFLYNNLMIQSNIIHSSYMVKVKKLVFLGSSCIYPKHAKQPISEDQLLSGPLEPTNEPYAIAKISGIKLCQAYRNQYNCDFISAMPTNLYGPNDNFDLNNSHVIPALIKKFINAKKNNIDHVVIWGSGLPKREFLHVNDCAKAILFLLKNYSGDNHINIGYGKDISIKELALTIKDIIGYKGDLLFDENKPDGTPRKLLCTKKINQLGWSPKLSLRKGLEDTILNAQI